MYDVLLFSAVLIGIVGGVLMLARSPSFWIDLGSEIFKRALPEILKVSPETIEKNKKAAREAEDIKPKWGHREH